MPWQLQTGSKTYDQVHHGLQWAFGPASLYLCATGCGSQAQDWAYQYTAGEAELKSHDGSPYSDEFDHYAPMCRSCHRSFDIRNDPARAVSKQFQPAGQRAIQKLLAADPSWGEYRSSNMKKLNGGQVGCAGCNLKTNLGALSIHQRATGHEGKVS